MSVLPQAGTLAIAQKCAVDPNRLMPLTLCVSWVGGCACLPFQIGPQFPGAYARNFRMKVNQKINDSCLVATEIVVDCMEEFVKYTILMRPRIGLGGRFSEQEEKESKGGER